MKFPTEWNKQKDPKHQPIYIINHINKPYIYVYVYIYMCVCVKTQQIINHRQAVSLPFPVMGGTNGIVLPTDLKNYVTFCNYVFRF